MSDIDQLQARISAAMDRMSAGLEQLGTGGGEASALQAALDEEKTVNAQLEERLRALKEKQTSELATAQAHMQETRAKVEALDLELQRLQQVNAQLRDANAALRDANAAGVGEPDLINTAMQAELDAIRTARAADVAEASAILSAMAPLLSGEAAQSGAIEEETADA